MTGEVKDYTEMYINAINDVFKFNSIVGNHFGDVYLDDNYMYQRYEKLITEEMAELFVAGIGQDRIGMIDALGDLFYVIVGGLYSLGITPEQINLMLNSSNGGSDLNEVHEKLLSCKTVTVKVMYLCDMLSLLDKIVDDLDVFFAIVDNVTEGNFSKFCENEHDAIASVDDYVNDTRYKDVYYEKIGDLYIIKGWEDSSETTGKPKILKGIHFKEPTHENIIQMIEEKSKNS